MMAGLCSIIKKLAAWLEEDADDITQPNPAQAREPMLEAKGRSKRNRRPETLEAEAPGVHAPVPVSMALPPLREA